MVGEFVNDAHRAGTARTGRDVQSKGGRMWRVNPTQTHDNPASGPWQVIKSFYRLPCYSEQLEGGQEEQDDQQQEEEAMDVD